MRQPGRPQLRPQTRPQSQLGRYRRPAGGDRLPDRIMQTAMVGETGVADDLPGATPRARIEGSSRRAPSGGAPPTVHNVAASLLDLSRQAASLADQVAAELVALRSASAAFWETPERRALAERVLPLSLIDGGARPEAYRLAGLTRRMVRLLREGAALRAQSDALRVQVATLLQQARTLRARSRALRGLPRPAAARGGRRERGAVS
jgi:hypothetical protein